jgi:hypothetical protein
LLHQYHGKGNSVITVSDELAGWIRADFPQYEIEASVIKDIHTIEKLESALQLYGRFWVCGGILCWPERDLREARDAASSTVRA